MEHDRMNLRTEAAKLSKEMAYCKICKTLQATRTVPGCVNEVVVAHKREGDVECTGSLLPI